MPEDVCPYHSKVEEKILNSERDRLKLWEQTGRKLSFRVFSAFIGIAIIALGVQYKMISGYAEKSEISMQKFATEVKQDIKEIKKSQYDLNTDVIRSVLRIEYGLQALSDKHINDQEKNKLERQLLEKAIENPPK